MWFWLHKIFFFRSPLALASCAVGTLYTMSFVGGTVGHLVIAGTTATLGICGYRKYKLVKEAYFRFLVGELERPRSGNLYQQQIEEVRRFTQESLSLKKDPLVRRIAALKRKAGRNEAETERTKRRSAGIEGRVKELDDIHTKMEEKLDCLAMESDLLGGKKAFQQFLFLADRLNEVELVEVQEIETVAQPQLPESASPAHTQKK